MKKARDAALSLLNNPAVMKSFNGWITILWIILIPVSIYFGWVLSVVFVSAISLWANVAAHLSSWVAGRIEIEQVTGTTLNEEDREWIIQTFEKYSSNKGE